MVEKAQPAPPNVRNPTGSPSKIPEIDQISCANVQNQANKPQKQKLRIEGLRSIRPSEKKSSIFLAGLKLRFW